MKRLQCPSFPSISKGTKENCAYSLREKQYECKAVNTQSTHTRKENIKNNLARNMKFNYNWTFTEAGLKVKKKHTVLTLS